MRYLLVFILFPLLTLAGNPLKPKVKIQSVTALTPIAGHSRFDLSDQGIRELTVTLSLSGRKKRIPFRLFIKESGLRSAPEIINDEIIIERNILKQALLLLQ